MDHSEEIFDSNCAGSSMSSPIDDANSWSSSCDEASDSDFCFDDDLLSESGSVTKLQPRKAVIKACWNDELSMSEVLHHKCRLLVSLGIVRTAKIYLSIEETLFSAEIGALMLVNDKDASMPLKDLYEKVAQGKGGCSWEHFEVYRYLKSLGYIVGRHGIPWSLKSVKRCTMSIEGTSKKEGTMPTELDETLIVESMKGLQIREMIPFFDVYLPNSKFKKTSPSSPAFTVSLARHQPPSRSDIEELEKQCNGIPLKVVHVEHGRVTFFSFDHVDLPSLP